LAIRLVIFLPSHDSSPGTLGAGDEERSVDAIGMPVELAPKLHVVAHGRIGTEATDMLRSIVGISLLFMAAAAEAYVGPGMGLGVIGAILGFLAAFFLALVGLVWYPLKRMIRARQGSPVAATDPAGLANSEPAQRTELKTGP
jgi:hypothetical protein